MHPKLIHEYVVGRALSDNVGECKRCSRPLSDPIHHTATPNAFPFKVGDRITSIDLTTDGSVVITAIGEQGFLARVYGCADWMPDGTEKRFNLAPYGSGSGNRWERCVEPVVYPELWMTVNRDGTIYAFSVASNANLAVAHPCIGILHLRSDGTTEMLNPNPERSNTP